jgi:hypothetical protein
MDNKEVAMQILLKAMDKFPTVAVTPDDLNDTRNISPEKLGQVYQIIYKAVSEAK